MGNKTTVINQTSQDIEIREFRNKSVDYFDVIELGATESKEVDGRKYRDRAQSTKQISLLRIWGKRSERLAKEPVTLVAQDFIDSKTITITGEGRPDDRDYRFVVTKESHGGEKTSQKEDPIEEGRSDKNKDPVEKGGSDYKKDPTEEGRSEKKKDQGSDKKKDPVEEGPSDKKKDPGEEGRSDKEKGGHEQNQKKKSPVENGGGEQKMTKN